MNAKDERTASDSDELFFYKTRKKAIGPFKRQMWDLPAEAASALAAAYDQKFTFLFTQLAVGGTRKFVRQFVHPMAIHRPMPGTEGHLTVAAAPDDMDLSD